MQKSFYKNCLCFGSYGCSNLREIIFVTKDLSDKHEFTKALDFLNISNIFRFKCLNKHKNFEFF